MYKSCWLLEKRFSFEAAHHLPSHDGRCQRPHGHSFVGRLRVVSGSLHESGPKAGMAIDFADLKKAIQPLLDDYLDHYDLNQTLDLENPTSEAIARWVYRKIKASVSWSDMLYSVVIEETCTSSCEYREIAELNDMPGAKLLFRV